VILCGEQGNDPEKLIKTIRRYQRKGKVQAAYEAGCMGYPLQRKLQAAGIDCIIIPANTVFRPGNETKVKTDRRDAALIARMLKQGQAKGIYIPTPEDEAARDLLRCRGDIVDDLSRAKQRLQKFLLRHEYRYEGKTYWTKTHIKWIEGLSFDQPLSAQTRDEYLGYIRTLQTKIERLEERLRAVAESPRYQAPVQKLRAFRGIDYVIALSLVCEVGDFRRFPDAPSFMSYLGPVPSERSSGKTRRRGGITKTGNNHLRKLLTEAAWQYPRPVKESKRLVERRKGTAERVIARADKAMEELHRTYYHLVHGRKNANVAVTAVSRRLAGYIWDVMTMEA
jgi:transposase